MTNNKAMIDQLKSLSIDRDDETPAPSQKARASKPKSKLLKRLTMTTLLAAGLVGGAHFFDYDVNKAGDFAQNLAASYMPAAEADAAPVKAVAAAPKIEVPTATQTTEPAPVAVPVARAVIGSGFVLAEREMALKPAVSGLIAELPFDMGDSFEEGDVLVQLDASMFQIDLDIALAEVASAQVAHARAEYNRDAAAEELARVTTFVEKGIKPKATLIEIKETFARSENDVAQALSAIKIAELNVVRHRETLEQYTLRAPFSGVVVSRNATVGAMATSGLDGPPSEGVLTLIDPTALVIEVDIAEANLGEISIGQGATVALDAYPGKDMPATVVSIAQKASLQKGTIAVRLRFSTPPLGVLANMAAKVNFSATNS